MARFRKRAAEIEAFQLTVESRRNNSEWPEWMNRAWQQERHARGALYPSNESEGLMLNSTLGGLTVHVSLGDWIITDGEGGICSCSHEALMQIYEPVEEEVSTEQVAVSLKDVLGSLAMWAVRQSPYVVPERLEAGITEFEWLWSLPHDDVRDVRLVSVLDLRAEIERVVKASPTISAWNKSKDGVEREYVFVTAVSGPAPDSDFIDLDALARNIYNTVVNEE